VAVAEVDGPRVALAEIDRLAGSLADYHAFHAARAELLRRLDLREAALEEYDGAIALAGNTAEMAYLTRRRDQLVGSGSSSS
jgi:RNA polymerase sigma-70 factor, ECF subfamily